MREPSTWMAPLAEISPRKEKPSLKIEGFEALEEMKTWMSEEEIEGVLGEVY